MKSKGIRKLLRLLITLLGGGLGAAVSWGGFSIYQAAVPREQGVPMMGFVLYAVLIVSFAVLFFFLSPRVLDAIAAWMDKTEDQVNPMSLEQILSSITGLILGFIIAYLIGQLIWSLGRSWFITMLVAIIYVVLGTLGFTIGKRRAREFRSLLGHLPSTRRREESAVAPVQADTRMKLLDTSALIDGRILEVARTGILEGTLVAPGFVLEELRRIADSKEHQRRSRGRRGMDVLQSLQEERPLPLVMDDRDYPDIPEVDLKLLRMAQDTGASLITGDYNLNRVATLSGVKVLNLNDLANALRPAIIPGEEMELEIVREGKEYGQGVGFLPDGTMMVVDDAKPYIGLTVPVVILSVHQNSAGRMYFAKIKDGFYMGNA